MSFFDNVTEYMDKYRMLSGVNTVIVGVSGGADSVALLRVLVSIREKLSNEKKCSLEDALKIKAVHINHCIRGEEALRDENFVLELSKKLGVQCKVYSENIPQMALEKHLTEEEAGRIFRYQCFNREADMIEAPGDVRIAVAHNKDDLAETVLFNMIRGSSLLGLSGIKPVNGRIIRPLLMTSREEIEKYLEEISQKYITDSTNLQTDYSRNKIRLSIIPQLKEINEGAVDHIVNISNDALNLDLDIDREIASMGITPRELNIDDMNKLSGLAKGELVLSALEGVCGRRKDITREHILSVIKLSEMESGKKVDLPYNMYAYRSYGKIVVSSYDTPEEISSLGKIRTEVIENSPEVEISKKEYTKMIDYDKIKSTLVLRTPMEDDFMVIDRNGGTKKLARLFTHSKVDREARKTFPVVADGNEIVWAVGLRLSERYKVTPETKRVMEIHYEKEV